MKRLVLWVLFVILLLLIISPIDFAPGPVDDIVYGILDVVIIALLGLGKERKKKLPPPEGDGSVAAKDSR